MTNSRAIPNKERALAVEHIKQDMGVMPTKNLGFVYLAGPYRGTLNTHDWTVYAGIDANINTAREWASVFATDGIPYLCPHMNSAHMEVIVPEVPTDYWLLADLAMLHHASAIFMLPGWRESKGAMSEREYAKAYDIKLFTHNQYDTKNGILSWWANGKDS